MLRRPVEIATHDRGKDDVDFSYSGCRSVLAERQLQFSYMMHPYQCVDYFMH
jgi:hypothetical protein